MQINITNDELNKIKAAISQTANENGGVWHACGISIRIAELLEVDADSVWASHPDDFRSSSAEAKAQGWKVYTTVSNYRVIKFFVSTWKSARTGERIIDIFPVELSAL